MRPLPTSNSPSADIAVGFLFCPQVGHPFGRTDGRFSGKGRVHLPGFILRPVITALGAVIGWPFRISSFRFRPSRQSKGASAWIVGGLSAGVQGLAQGAVGIPTSEVQMPGLSPQTHQLKKFVMGALSHDFFSSSIAIFCGQSQDFAPRRILR